MRVKYEVKNKRISVVLVHFYIVINDRGKPRRELKA